MNNTLLTELFLFFARYPNKVGINKMFNKGTSKLPQYKQLMDTLQALPDESIVPGINQYVFGPNFDAVSARVNNIPTGEYYLFVDYGEIECDTDRSNRMTDSAQLAITVACKLKEFSGDLIEQLIVSDQSLYYLIEIRNQIIRKEREQYWLKNISKNHTLTPFMAKELSSTGWTLLFNRESYDTFGAKKR